MDVNAALEKTAPALPPPSGEIVRVKNIAELRRAIHEPVDNSTILLADGTYEISEPLVLHRGKNIAIRSESGDPKKVKLRGKGFEAGSPGDDILRIAAAENITIAQVSFEECRSYGIKVEAEHFPKSIHIYDCRFKNIGVRAIKGSTSLEGRVVNGSIKFCRFENTKIPPADWLSEGNYITAIDMMTLDGWTISDNVFKHILGRSGQARGAIFLWVRCRNLIVERNLIINCNRGISFGNPSGSSAFVEGEDHVSDSIIRNNMIVTGPDACIELWWVKNIRVYNNSLYSLGGEHGRRGVRGGFDPWKLQDVELCNNLIHGLIELGEGATLTNNVAGELKDVFRDPKHGDLRVKSDAANARDAALPPEVVVDFTGRMREGTGVGAWAH